MWLKLTVGIVHTSSVHRARFGFTKPGLAFRFAGEARLTYERGMTSYHSLMTSPLSESKSILPSLAAAGCGLDKASFPAAPFSSILSAREVFSLAGPAYSVSKITLSTALAIAKRLTTPSTNPLHSSPLSICQAYNAGYTSILSKPPYHPSSPIILDFRLDSLIFSAFIAARSRKL